MDVGEFIRQGRTLGGAVLWIPFFYVMLLLVAHAWWGWGQVVTCIGRTLSNALLWYWLPKRMRIFER
jgi:hypothetical protein